MRCCRHTLGALNSVHFMMGLSCAYVAHNLCTIWHRFPSLAGVHTDCTHLQQHNRAFTMGVNKPYPSLSSHLKIYAEHAAPKELVFILCSTLHWEKISESTLNFVYLSQVNNTHTKQPVRLRKNHYWDGNYKISFCGHVLITFNLLHCSTIRIFNARTLSVEFLLR